MRTGSVTGANSLQTQWVGSEGSASTSRTRMSDPQSVLIKLNSNKEAGLRYPCCQGFSLDKLPRVWSTLGNSPVSLVITLQQGLPPILGSSYSQSKFYHFRIDLLLSDGSSWAQSQPAPLTLLTNHEAMSRTQGGGGGVRLLPQQASLLWHLVCLRAVACSCL